MENKTNSRAHENEFIQSFLKQNSSVMMLIDPKTGEILEANSAAFRFYGYDDLLSMNIKSINTLTNIEIDELLQLALNGEKNHFEFKHKVASGDIKDVEVYSTPFETDDRNVLFSIVHDITRRKEAIKNSSILSKAVLDLFQFSTPHEVYAYTIDKLYELVNQKAVISIVEYDNPGRNNWNMMEVRGLNKSIERVLKKVGIDIHQMSGDVKTSFLNELKKGKLASLPFDLQMLTNGKYSNKIASSLKKLLPIEDILVMPFIRENVIYGTVTIAPTSKKHNINIPLIEAFISQTAIFLEKIFTEKALTESEQKLLAAEKIANIGNYEINLKTGHSKWSEETFHIFGMNPQTDRVPTADEYAQFIHSQDKEKLYTHYNNSIKNGHNFNLTYRIIRKDEEVRHVKSNGKVVKNTLGEPIKMFGTFQDITEAKIAEEKIVQSEKKYRAIFENSHDLISIHHLTEDGFEGFPEVNDQVISKLGFTKEEFKKLNIFDIVPKEEHPKMHKAIEEIFKHGKASIETYHTTKSGKIIPVEVNGYISEVGNQKFLTVVTRSLEEQKKAEQAIIESKNYFQALIEKSTDIISILDKNGFIKYKSPSHESILGYNQNELIGVNCSDMLHPEDRGPIQKQIKELIKKQGESEKLNFRYKHKNGSWCYMEGTAKNLLDVQSIEGIVINYRDVTERIIAEEKLIKAKEKAEESERLKTAFLANMSHEIRTPMNGILGFIDILREPDIPQDERDIYFDLVKKSGDRLMTTINDIIEISKIEANQTHLYFTDENLSEIMQEHLNFFKPEAAAKNITLKLAENSDHNRIIHIDKNKLDSILTNLIKNAIKFTMDGMIEFGCIPKNGQLEFYVKDTGVGISQERIEAIFNRFEQADLGISRGHEGSGLGLSISKAYAEMLGGNLWVESEKGKGSTFFFTINLTPAEKTKATHHANYEKIEENNAIAKVLIAEDDEISFALVETFMAKEKIQLLHAENGKEAVVMTKENEDIDLILMDLKMPIMDGYTATREIRKFNKNIPIIAQTAYALPGDREIALEAGCDDYLSKPLKKADIIEKINMLADK